MPVSKRATLEPDRYLGVHGEGNVARILDAVAKSGGRVVRAPDPSIAPFELTVRTPTGEEIELICYAFTANQYKQGGRPSDEHRFQIKYGSDFSRYHRIFIDQTGRRVTLFFGVHKEENLFVAVDPVMHNPTWFSSSVEFKAHDLAEAGKKGWHGWERERSDARRKKERPQASNQTEAVIGFRPEYFLRYVEFERRAAGLDAGERLLLSDRVASGLDLDQPAEDSADAHPLEAELGLSSREILDLIRERFRLMVAVRGGVAERHLGNRLRSLPEISDIRRIDEDGQPDYAVRFSGRLFRIECKNVLRRPPSSGLARVDFQKTRASIGKPCTRYYDPAQFEVLAACMHPVTESWDFRFQATSYLPPHPRCPGKLASNVLVTDAWSPSLPELLDGILRA